MDVQVALLEWINTFTLTEEVKSLSDLIDGHILWDILRDVDPTYFASSLPEGQGNTSKWIPRYNNLKFLHKTLVSYISEECDQALFALDAGEGLQAIAQNAPDSASGLVLLFQLVLQATILSPRQEEYILKMTSLTPASQQALKRLIEEREITEEPHDQQDGPNDTALEAFAPDPDLAFEERFANTMAENRRLLQERAELRKEMRELDDRLTRLQDNNAILQQKLMEAEDGQQMNGSARNSDNKSVKDLESKIKQQENDFADQESKTLKQQRRMEALQRKIDNLEASLSSSARKTQDARDELDEVTRERDVLTRKANMVEKLKQQLQSSNSLKKEKDTLQGELEECRKQVESLQQAKRDKVGLETELEEYKKLLPRIEEDNADVSRIKRQLELDNESLRKQHKQDQTTIAQLHLGVRSSSVSSVGSHDDSTLEGEFSGLADNQTRANERTTAVEKQNKQLESTVSEQSSKIQSLQRLLDEANSRPKIENDIRRHSFSESIATENLSAARGFGVPLMTGIAQPADSMISLESVEKMRSRCDAAETKTKMVDDQLRKKALELEMAKNDRRSLLHYYMDAAEQHANHLAVAYVPLDQLEVIARTKANESTEIRLLQETNDRLESENREQRELLSQSIGQNSTIQDDLKLVPKEIKDLTAAIKGGKTLQDSSKALDYFSQIIQDGRKDLMKTQEVNQEIVLSVIPTQSSPVQASPKFELGIPAVLGKSAPGPKSIWPVSSGIWSGKGKSATEVA
ncbi:MAG: hypothetical protein LQ346_005294 [Caloplaca aetnensis]|nr:MAG: hypothetical protein LQ346_005294 [Caloplaca aetnensis]